jgi:hypothetical protein
VSPTAAEKPHEHLNAQIKLYTDAMKKVAKPKAWALPSPSFAVRHAPREDSRTTTNGVHLNREGYAAFAERLYNQLTQETPPKLNEAVRAAVVEKEDKFFQHYRPLNYYYIKGGRMEPYGVVNFPGELKKLLQMTEARDAAIWASVNQVTPVNPVPPDDSRTDPLPTITGDRPINEWLSPADELKAFKIDPRFEVSLFASEEDFPELFVKPIAIRFDGKGRLWVSTSTTYPQIMPGEAPQDKILILEDTNGDHRADKCSVWADKLAIPLSFEFGNGGVFVSDQPHLTFLKDTDGDGKADHREKLLTGFGTEDSHHALHDFVWSPEGDLIFRESIFHHSQVETPYGPVRARESSFFRYTPATGRLLAFGSYMSTNPWGITFDDWGFHVGSHPVFASAVHALNAPYPDIHIPAGNYFPAYSGTCGQEFLTSSHWPKELRDKKHFMRVRYKPTNEVELHEWVEHDTHFEEKKVGIVFQSTNLSFIPVDIQQGPDGAMYIADWYNPVKGHAQYSLRDTRRDKKSGRIWRITAKDQKLEEAPKIAGASIPELLDLLKSENYRTRYRAKVELREREALCQRPQRPRPPRSGHRGELHRHAGGLGGRARSAEAPDGPLPHLRAAHLARQPHAAAALEGQHRLHAEASRIGKIPQRQRAHQTRPDGEKEEARAAEPLRQPARPANHHHQDHPRAPALRPARVQSRPRSPREARFRKSRRHPAQSPHRPARRGGRSRHGRQRNGQNARRLRQRLHPRLPEDPAQTKMLNQGDREVLRFTAPTAKGKYPYICTFPGHWLVMKGEMVVE